MATKGFEGFMFKGTVVFAPDRDEISVSIVRDTGATLFLLVQVIQAASCLNASSPIGVFGA